MAQLPRDWGESPSLEVFQSCRDVALRDVGSGHSKMGCTGDLRGLSQPLTVILRPPQPLAPRLHKPQPSQLLLTDRFPISFFPPPFFLWTHSASFLQCGAFLTIWKHAVPASSSIHQIFGASAFFGFLIVQPKRKQREREIPVEQPPLTQESRSCPLPALLGGPGPDQGKDGTGTRRDKTTMLRTTYLNSMRQTRSLCVSHHDGN